MTISLTLPTPLEQEVRAGAELRQVPIETYLLSLVESAVEAAVPKIKPAPRAGESHEQFMAAMRSLSQTSTPVDLPYQTWPREAIYQDHD